MPQPVKNSTNYEKYLSNEIKNLIEDVVLKVLRYFSLGRSAMQTVCFIRQLTDI